LYFIYNEKLKGRIKQAAIEMENDPWHKGTIKVEGYENMRRKRGGKYMLLYAVDRHRKEVLVVKIHGFQCSPHGFPYYTAFWEIKRNGD